MKDWETPCPQAIVTVLLLGLKDNYKKQNTT